MKKLLISLLTIVLILMLALVCVADTGVTSTEGNDIMRDTKNISENNAPLDWYAKDFEGGKKITVNILGDSISADTAKNELSQKYHGVWASKFNMDVNNWSRGGSAVTGDYKAEGKLLETYVPRMERMIEGNSTAQEAVTSENKPDILIVWGGTNDYNGHWTIGNPGDDNRSTFCGAIYEIITMARDNYPDAKLVFFTPIKRCDYTPAEGWDNSGKRRYELDEYVNAMLETCEYYGVPCLDFYNNERLEFIGLRSLYITDGVHLSAAGHKIFADVAVEEMEKAGIIKTHGYTETVSRLYPLHKGRPLSADSHIFDADRINTLTTYSTGTLLDRQRLAKHTLTEGAVRFTPETLTSKIAPTVTLNLNNLGFSAVDYPYVCVTYKTSSTAEKVNVAFRANNNRVSTPETMPELISETSATLLFNIKDFANDEIVLPDGKYYNDMYLTLGFFESTYDMNKDSFIDIESIAFFKYPLDAMLYRYELTGEEIERGSGFADTLTHWGCDSIDYAVKERLFNGVTKTEFMPNNTMTRGMLAVVLARLAEDTENTSEYPFADVDKNAWFAKGVSFAYANGIVDAGVNFRPDDNITREELADMLYRYAKKTGKKVELTELAFADTDKISADKRDAIAYCVNAGIIKGYDNNTVNPTGSATRAEVATMIYRFMQA